MPASQRYYFKPFTKVSCWPLLINSSCFTFDMMNDTATTPFLPPGREMSIDDGPSTSPTGPAVRLGIARRLFWPWTSVLCALSSLLITAIYASQYPLASQVQFIYDSSSNTIFILSLLSGISGLLLGATLSSTFELIQWAMLIRTKGLQLLTFLAIHAGTGVFGWVSLIFGRGLPWKSSARSWGAVRLLSSLLVPLLGVLIMSELIFPSLEIDSLIC
jgi:hypothetical protein